MIKRWLLLITMSVSVGLNIAVLYHLLVELNDDSKDFSLVNKKALIDHKRTRLYGGIVRIINRSRNSSCTGAVISDNYAVTAAHCFNRGDKLSIVDENYTVRVEASPAALSGKVDVGLIQGSFGDFKILRVNWANINLRSSFMSCGYPHNQNKLFCSPAIFTNNENFRLHFTGMLIPGMSGGPIIDMNTEEVVAVNSAVGHSYCIGGPLLGLESYFNL